MREALVRLRTRLNALVPFVLTRCVAVLILCVASTSSQAQNADPAGGEDDPWAGIEEMVVTGSGAAALVQESTVSVLAFSGEAIQAAQINDIGDLADYTPNLEIKTGASSVASLTIFIRGIGLLDFNSNAASSVAIFNDGVYQNSPLGQLFQFYDLENVEVLRGPQGSLNARNATAGAIRVTPRRPSGEVEGYATGTVGDYERYEAEAAVGFPIYEDILTARIAGRFSQRDGFVKNRCADNPNSGTCVRLLRPDIFGLVASGLPDRVNDEDIWGARLMLRFQPPNLETDWILNLNGGQSRGLAYQFQSRGSRLGRDDEGVGFDALRYKDPDGDPFAGDYDLVEEEKLDLFAASLNGTTQIGDFTLKSITGYSSAELDAARDFDASPNRYAHVIPSNEVWQATQTLQVTADLHDDFELDVGGFFLYERLDTVQDLLEGIVVITQRQEVKQETVTWAAFAQGRYHISETLRFDGGVRYNWERKSFDLVVLNQPSLQVPTAGQESRPPESTEEIWDQVTGEAVLTWLPTENISIYGKYTHGFKGGHFNGGAFFSAQLIEAVEPEIIDAFEVGMKTQFLDGLFTLNAAAWYYDYENYQVFALQNTVGQLPLSQLLNAPRVESRGIELELLISEPIEGLNLNISLAVLDAKFSEFTVNRAFVPQNCDDPFPGTTLCPAQNEVLEFTGNPLVAAPPISLNVIASYKIDLGGFGMLEPRIDLNYRGKTYFTPGDQSSAIDGGGPNEGASQAPYMVVNARIAYETLDENIELAYWVRNLMDEKYLSNSLDTSNALGKFLDVYGPPRTMGVTARFKF